MYATSYHPSNTGSTTASGLPLKKGVAAVDRSLIPFYTQMFVPGYGEVIAADIGGGVAGRWIDLGYSDDDYVPLASMGNSLLFFGLRRITLCGSSLNLPKLDIPRLLHQYGLHPDKSLGQNFLVDETALKQVVRLPV